MTEELKKLIKTRIGYRNENVSHSGKMLPAKKILQYEYEELGNEDILDTLYSQEFIDEPTYEKAILFIDELNKIYEKELYGLWLCSSIKDVKENYPDNYEDYTISEVAVYKIPKEYVVLSDLGSQGILILSDKDSFNNGYIKSIDGAYLYDEKNTDYYRLELKDDLNNNLGKFFNPIWELIYSDEENEDLEELEDLVIELQNKHAVVDKWFNDVKFAFTKNFFDENKELINEISNIIDSFGWKLAITKVSPKNIIYTDNDQIAYK